MSNPLNQLERLVSSLVREGYALYPYTPGAAKNSTPTPFGILYPPAYAALEPTTFDHLQIECLLEAPPQASLLAAAHFLQACGPRHQAEERRMELPSVSVRSAAGAPLERVLVFSSTRLEPWPGLPPETTWDAPGVPREPPDSQGGGCPDIAVRLTLAADALGSETWRLRLRVDNVSSLEAATARSLDRAEALRRSLLSTHAVVRVEGGRFFSPLERDTPWAAAIEGCRNVNAWPVLATPGDDAVLGAAIFLPDHPQLAPESRGDLFDNTEIEEALLLHVHSLSDGEREEIGRQDPAVREMIERALATTPQDILSLHGRLEMSDPEPGGSDEA